jgi:hypothetical protein
MKLTVTKLHMFGSNKQNGDVAFSDNREFSFCPNFRRDDKEDRYVKDGWVFFGYRRDRSGNREKFAFRPSAARVAALESAIAAAPEPKPIKIALGVAEDLA